MPKGQPEVSQYAFFPLVYSALNKWVFKAKFSVSKK